MRARNEPIQPGITRLSISQWRQLYLHDRKRWLDELQNRPERFDRNNWTRAIRTWRVVDDSPLDPTPSSEGSLTGVPFVVKDLFDLAGEVTGCGSAVLLDALSPEPAREDALLVRRLKDSGAVPLGRAQMNEFAYGLDGKNSYTGDCLHPLDSARISGGSSSGSAWAVAAGIVPVALGTDTGGSVRVPAAICGIYGYRPAWSEAATEGVFPLANSFDTAGWFTAGARDMAILLRELVLPVEHSPAESADGSKPGRYWYYLPPEVNLQEELHQRILRWSEDLSAESRGKIEIVPAPDRWTTKAERIMRESHQAYNVVGSREAWNVHREWLDRYQEYYQPVVWGLIDRGRHWSEERVAWARTVVSEMKDLLTEATREAAGLVIPAVPVPTPGTDEIDSAFREQTLRLSTPGSMSGFPVLSVPVHVDAIRSGGVQVIVGPGAEEQLLGLLGSGTLR